MAQTDLEDGEIEEGEIVEDVRPQTLLPLHLTPSREIHAGSAPLHSMVLGFWSLLPFITGSFISHVFLSGSCNFLTVLEKVSFVNRELCLHYVRPC